jgi:hypothetical protein
MPLVPIELEIEESAFIPVLKVLKGFPGIAKIHFDLDTLGNKHGGRYGPRNGKAPPDPLVAPHPSKTKGRAGLKPLIVKALRERPHTYGELKKTAIAGGYKVSSTSPQLNDLRRAGVIAHDELGNWFLTPEFQAKTEAMDGEATERRALPPPDKKRSPAARFAILEILRAETGPLTRLELRHKMHERGFTSGTFDGALFRHQQDGLVNKIAKGFKITAAGRKAKTPEAAQPTEE